MGTLRQEVKRLAALVQELERELAIAEKMTADANEAYSQAHVSMVEAMDQLAAEKALADRLAVQLKVAEAALSDIGDAEREDDDDLRWCEQRAAKAIPGTRAELAAYRKARGL